MAIHVDTGKAGELAAARRGRTVKTVLLVIEDRLVRELLAVHLRAAGCFPLAVGKLRTARQLVKEVVPDLIVVDAEGGDDTCAQWAVDFVHQQQGRHILTVSLVGGPSDADLDQASDVDLRVAKPFEPRELVRQVLDLLGTGRRSSARALNASILKSRCIELDPDQPTVRVWRADGWHSLDLPANQHRLLAQLLSDPERVHSREAIRDALWPDASIDLRTVDQSVRRLRQSLGKLDAHHLVKTVSGVGYRLEPEVRP